jgi:hypothetical protein
LAFAIKFAKKESLISFLEKTEKNFIQNYVKKILNYNKNIKILKIGNKNLL